MFVCKHASTFAMVKYSIRGLVIGTLYTKNAFVISDFASFLQRFAKRHRVTIPMINRLMIKHASKITLTILSFTAFHVIKCIFESHNRKKQKQQIEKIDKN